MITLNKSNNTVLLYKQLVTEPLPAQVTIALVQRTETLVTTATVADHTHFYLVSFPDDLSEVPDQVTFTVSSGSLQYYVEHYKENAKII